MALEEFWPQPALPTLLSHVYAWHPEIENSEISHRLHPDLKRCKDASGGVLKSLAKRNIKSLDLWSENFYNLCSVLYVHLTFFTSRVIVDFFLSECPPSAEDIDVFGYFLEVSCTV